MPGAHSAEVTIRSSLHELLDSVTANRPAMGWTTGVCAVVAAVAWAFMPQAWDGRLAMVGRGEFAALLSWPTLLALLGVLALAVPIYLQHRREKVKNRLAAEREATIQSERAELVGLLQGYLKPCIEMLPDIARGGSEARQQLGNLEQAVLNTAQTICGPSDSGVRAVRFRVDKQTLVACAWSGGRTKSERRLSNRDREGAQAWDTARTGEPRLYPDLLNDPPAWYERGPNSDYQAFITCGVLTAGGDVRGMLNVDTPKAYDLDDTDRIIVGVCAKVLGVGYSLSDAGATF